eukprot:scaffold3636_cov114-Isochrysis_galbana.AAC.2
MRNDACSLLACSATAPTNDLLTTYKDHHTRTHLHGRFGPVPPTQGKETVHTLTDTSRAGHEKEAQQRHATTCK